MKRYIFMQDDDDNLHFLRSSGLAFVKRSSDNSERNPTVLILSGTILIPYCYGYRISFH